MVDIKTDWFSMETPPVRPGTYEVVAMYDLISEVETVAEWNCFLGQWGFWEVKTWINRSSKTLLKVSKWRGRLLPRRVPLLPDPPSVRERRKLL